MRLVVCQEERVRERKNVPCGQCYKHLGYPQKYKNCIYLVST